MKVLFNTVDEQELQGMLRKPEFSLSIDFIKQAFNYTFGRIITQYGKLGALQFVCAIIVSSVLLSNVFRYLTQRVLEHLKTHSVAKLRQAVFDQAISLHLGFFSNERKGNIISRITTDVQEVENSIAYSFTAAFKEPVSIIGYFVVLFTMSAKLTFFTLLIIPISGVVIASLVKRLKKEAARDSNRWSALTSIADEVFSGMRIVKAFNAAEYVKDKFYQENQHYKRTMRSMAYKRELASPFSEFMGVSVVAGILLYGGSLVLSNQSELTAEAFVPILFSSHRYYGQPKRCPTPLAIFSGDWQPVNGYYN